MKRYTLYPTLLIILIIVTLIGGLSSYNSTSALITSSNKEINADIQNSVNTLQLSKILSDLTHKNFELYNGNGITSDYINGLQNDMLSDIEQMEKILPRLDFQGSDIQEVFDDFTSHFNLLKENLLKTDNIKTINLMQRDLDLMIDYASSKLYQTKTSVIQNLLVVRRYILFALMVVVTIEIIFVLLILLNAFSPLLSLVSKLKIISSGDLRIDFNKRHCGIFKYLIEDLDKFIKTINNSFLEIKNVSLSIKEKSYKILGSNRIFLSKLNDITKNEDEISQSAFNIRESINALLDNTNKSLNIVESTMESVNNTNSLIDKTDKAVEEMFANSKKLEEIFKFIDQIATQTNILAINASVEASKAGDYGKVFAIIAKDIRELSIKTSKYSEDSKNLIKINVKNIEIVKTFSEDVVKSFENVKNKFIELKDEVEIIGKALPQEHEKITQISNNIDSISKILKDYMRGVENLNTISDELSNKSETLLYLANTLKLKSNGK